MSATGMDARIQSALIGAIGGFVGGLVIAVVGHYAGIESNRRELLETARRDAYVAWLEAHTYGIELRDLRSAGRRDEADSVQIIYDRTGRDALGEIAIYGSRAVVVAVADWFEAFGDIPECMRGEWREEVRMHQAMRASLLNSDEAVSDNDMALLILACSVGE